MPPVILLTCSGLRVNVPADPPAGGEIGHPEWQPSCSADLCPTARGCLKRSYIDSVERAGGVPMLLVNMKDPASAEAAVARADALLLTGGHDVDPSLYGQRRHATVTITDPLRDANEIAAIRAALARRIPILGICRGQQMLNVALGGTLIQDIPSHHATATAPGNAGTCAHGGKDHAIRVESGTLLHRLWLTGDYRVNSRHHQAVGTLSPQLRAIAWAPDGIVEAVEAIDGTPVLALQCHPEDLSATDEQFLKPFQWLVQSAT